MSILLRISGPDFRQEVAIDVEASPLTIGREAGVGLTLPDPDKSVSRRHLTVRPVVEGVEVQVVSKVNGIDTSRGPLAPGQTTALAAGDSFQLGPFHFQVDADGAERASTPKQHAAPSHGAPSITPEEGRRMPSPARPVPNNDDIAAFLQGAAPSDPFGNDPFVQPAFHPAASQDAADDPFRVLSSPDAFRSAPRRGQPAAAATGNPAPEQAGWSPVGSRDDRPRRDGAARPVDEWIRDEAQGAGSGAQSGPLDAVLGRGTPAPRALAPDHVHGINLPLQLPGAAWLAAAPEAVPPPNATTPARLTPPPDSAWPAAESAAAALPSSLWDSLVQGADATAAPAEALAVGASAVAPGGRVDGTVPNVGEQPPADAQPPAVRVAATPTAAADPGPTPAPSSNANQLWLAFARGLQWPAGHTDEAAAERAGAMVRVVIEGLSELLKVRAELKREMRDLDRTVLSTRDNNPLKQNLTADELVRYLFVSQEGAGYMPADRAVRESVSDLRIHQHAAIAAARAALAGALRDFEPGRLKQQMLPAKASWFRTLRHARLWDAYERKYQDNSQNMADWLEKMFERHFMPAYLREIDQLENAAD